MTIDPGAGSRSTQRLLLLVPPLVHLLAGVALLIAALAAWGVADPVGYPAWAPTAGGLIVVVPIVAFESAVMLLIWNKTAAPFHVERRRIWLGLVAFAALTAMAIAYVTTIGNFETYKGDFNILKNRYDPYLTLNTFLSLNVLAALVMPSALFMGMIKVFYVDSIQGVSKQVIGPDPIGEIMRSRASG